MKISSKNFSVFFFLIAMVARISAQEADLAATPDNAVALSASAPVESQAASQHSNAKNNAVPPPVVEKSAASAEAISSDSANASASPVVGATTTAVADPAPQDNTTSSADGSASASAAGSTAADAPTDPSMIPPPETAPANAEGSTPAASEIEQPTPTPPMPSTESIEKKKEELKVRYYEVRTQVEKDPDVAALKSKADQAMTDEAKRQALRAYYELLFSKMKKIDSAISKRCDLMQGAYLRRLEQAASQPTIPLALPPNKS